jgi:hypothetical protein
MSRTTFEPTPGLTPARTNKHTSKQANNNTTNRTNRTTSVECVKTALNSMDANELRKRTAFGSCPKMPGFVRFGPAGGGLCKMNAIDSLGTETGVFMSLTCPVCRAVNEGGPSCRRCRADLSLLFAVEAQREARLAAARLALAQGQPVLASHQARQADELRHGADAAKLSAIVALMQRDFGEAWRQFRRARKLSG